MPVGFDKFNVPNCDVNKIEEPAGTKPLHQIVEEYAKDQNAWIADFIPTLEKMMSNGYEDGELIGKRNFWFKILPLDGAHIEQNPIFNSAPAQG